MNKASLEAYRDPRNPEKELRLEEERGCLVANDAKVFPVSSGIPNLTWPEELASSDFESKQIYDSLGADYDKFASIPFQTFKCNEGEIRNRMIDLMHLSSKDNILEVGCGTGRGSLLIAERLTQGRLFLQEISSPLLELAREKLESFQSLIEFSIGNASYLPFENNYFDALHHFGGLNTFAEQERFFQEAVRVVKPGGRVVVGDESLGPWLKDVEFGKILVNSNPLLKCPVPLELLPVEAREVTLQWIMLGAYYVLSFTVADGAPEADYHVEIPSSRGGTHWTRYYGQLEGVTSDAKKLAYQAQKKSGFSMTEWLSMVVSEAATRQLKD